MTVSNGLGIIIGIVVIIIGFVLLINWWHSFAVMFEGIFPILLILIGAGVLIYFISESKSKAEIEKEEKTTPEQK
jgi:multisubunit Na+/H+ antiporter MnhG subunit